MTLYLMIFWSILGQLSTIILSKEQCDRLSHDMVTSDVDRIRRDYIVRQTILVALLEV